MIIYLITTFICMTLSYIFYRRQVKKKKKKQEQDERERRQKEYDAERLERDRIFAEKAKHVDLVIERRSDNSYIVYLLDGNDCKTYLNITTVFTEQVFSKKQAKYYNKTYTRNIIDYQIPKDLNKFCFSGSATSITEEEFVVVKQAIEYYQKYQTFHPVSVDRDIIPLSRPELPKPNMFGMIDPKPNTMDELIPLLIEAEQTDDSEKLNEALDRIERIRHKELN